MGAVSSFTPPNEPAPGWLPPPQDIEKDIFQEGEEVFCQACKKAVYTVKKKITTKTKLSELIDCLTPYSPEVPLLTGETEVKKIAPAAVHCPLCKKEWGVIIYA